MQACDYCSVNDVKRILSFDPITEIRYRNDYGTTPLMVACIKGSHQIVELLLQHNPNEQVMAASIPEGWTPLMLACLHNYVPIVNILANHNMHAQCMMRNFVGETAMTIALALNHVECVQIMNKFMIKSEI
jgi:ankyrin repeat protein